MDTNSILEAIDAEIETLQKARRVLSGESAPGDGRQSGAAASKPAGRKNRLSPAARKRIGDAQRKRWAASRSAKSEVKPASATKTAKHAPIRQEGVGKAAAKAAKTSRRTAPARKAAGVPGKKPGAANTPAATPNRADDGAGQAAPF